MYRDAFEKCPRCAVELVDARSARGCRACGGLWVEEAILTEMILAMLPPRPQSRLVLAVLDRSGAPIGCPTCGEAMEATAIHEVILDRCARHGIWFDARELEDALREVALSGHAPLREVEIDLVAARLAPRPAAAPPPSGDVVLVFSVREPGRPSYEVRVQQHVIKLGRLRTSHVLLDDPRVSRLHAVIEAISVDDVSVIDLGATEGTLLNGRRVQKQRLASGDTLQLGGTSLRVTIEPARARAP